MKHVLLLLALAGAAAPALGQENRERGGGDATAAQTTRLAGRVVDENGQALAGATVQVIDKASGRVVTGALTDANGAYTVSVPGSVQSYTLNVSYVGYARVTQDAADNAQVQLRPDDLQLNEVVVQGYGSTLNRQYVTGAISRVEGEQLTRVTAPSFEQMLQGRATGVQVTQGSGRLGEAPSLRIRGVSSLTNVSEPLYVIDGVPTFSGDPSLSNAATNALANINPNDIQSISILKDAQATALYGSRASAGVVLITTKRGRQGKPQVAYNGWVGITEAASTYDLLGADDYELITNERLAANPATAGFLAQRLPGNNTDTDWQDVVTQTGLQHSHNLSIGGGSESTSYYASIGYTDQESFIFPEKLVRGNARINVDHRLTSFLKAGFNFAYNRTYLKSFNGGFNSIGTPYRQAMLAYPNVAPRNADGSLNVGPSAVNRLPVGDNTFTPTTAGQIIRNPLGYTTNDRQSSDQQQLEGNAYLEIIPVEGLRWRTQYGWNYLNVFDEIFYNPLHGESGGVAGRGQAFDGYTQVYLWNLQSYVNYDKTFGDHTVNATAGVEYQSTDTRQRRYDVSQFVDPFFTEVASGTFNTTGQIVGANTLQSFSSYYATVNYAFRERYLVGVAYRNDGISDLQPDVRRGDFYGVSAGWRFTEEPFVQSLGLDWLSSGKLRASYGEVGNANLQRAYLSFATYSPGTYGSSGGFYVTNPGNPDLKWETTATFDAGIELALFDSRVNLTLDFYRKQTVDLILAVPQPTSLGHPDAQLFQNVAAIRNQGIELGISATVLQKGDFSWNSTLNFTTVNGRVLSLYGGLNQLIYQPTVILRVGQPIGEHFNYRYAGVNPTTGNPQWIKGNGRLVETPIGGSANSTFYVDDGTVAGSLSPTADRYAIGSTQPTYLGSFDNIFRYKNWELGIFLTFSGGNKIFNNTRTLLLGNHLGNNSKEILGRWTPDNPNASIPRVRALDNNFTNFAGDFFYEDGDFLRVRNVQLAYTFPREWAEVLQLSSVRAYVSVTNLAVLTGYSGIDPEANRLSSSADRGTRNIQFSVDSFNMPQARNYVFGLNVGF